MAYSGVAAACSDTNFANAVENAGLESLPRERELECLSAAENDAEMARGVAAAVAVLTNSTEFGDYFKALISSSGVSVCQDPLSFACRGYFEPEGNIIAVAPGLTEGQKVIILAHELRHLDQHERGYPLSLKYDLREYVRQTFALEADAQAFAVLVAWSLREYGNDEPWTAAVGFEEFSDIAKVFEEAVRAENSPGEVMRLTFKSWYSSPWRLEKYCLSAAGDYLDQLEVRKAIGRYEELPPDRFNTLCEMPDSSNYGCDSTVEIARKVTFPCIPPT
ncbi:ImmA/IrrE family metallo-endopeptidase [Chelativorans alearense]|uniref:ImmA/IrrE family metallo-endopeptidase n=1 Tax=Chelativorans alearense TaxID=2681495 RepID=UPI0013D8B9CB|nr:ImmA/IrrE family metallo-endopeptidase [Chelativorans alearense]